MQQMTTDLAAEANVRGTMPSPLDELIDAAVCRLSRAELRVAHVVRMRPHEAARLSISALAARSFTSDPTVVRFCHHLGFTSFRQLKQFLASDAAAAGLRLGDGVDIGGALSDIVCDLVRHQAWNLLQLRHRVINNSVLAGAVERLAAAPELHFCGTGRSVAVVEHARSVFAGSGGSVHAHIDPGPWPSLVEDMPDTALVVAVWDERPGDAVQALVRAVRRRRLPVLGIAACEDRLATECDWALTVGPDTSPDGGATPLAILVAQSTLLDALARCTEACRRRSAPALFQPTPAMDGPPAMQPGRASRQPSLRRPAPHVSPAPAEALGA